MKIKFKNLAHISNGEFESNKLTILMGDNGSGKTLLLEAYSFIAEFYNQRIAEVLNKVVLKNIDHIHISVKTDQLVEILSEYYSKEKDSNEKVFIRKLDYNIYFSKPDQLSEEITSEIMSLNSIITERIKIEILNSMSEEFTFDLLDFPVIESRLFEEKLSMYMIDKDNMYFAQTSGIIEIEFARFLKDDYEKLLNNKIVNVNDLNVDMIDLKKILDTHENELIVDFILNIYQSYFLKGDVVYFPSERNSDYLELLFKSVGPAQFEGLVRYSELNYQNFIKEQRSYRRLLASDSISHPELTKLIGGNPIYNKDGEVTSIKIGSLNLSKRMFSTKIIRTLPYLNLDLITNRYKTIIIEEPEAHLSLKSMNDLVTLFKVINRYSDIIITTHSDVFYQKVINLIKQNKTYNDNVSAYELLKTNDTVTLEKCSENDFGFEVKFFKELLEKHYYETINVEDGVQNDN